MGKHRLRRGGCPWGIVVVLASFTVHLLITAMTRCTGVLFSSFQNAFQSTSAQTGAISSIVSSFTFYGCTLSGVLGNRFGCRITTVLAGLINIMGMIGIILARNIYQMYVMSAVVGTGNGVAYAAAIVIVAKYHDKSYPLACGFMAAGNALGLVVFGPFIQFLVDTYGWRGALLVTCAVTANICAAGVAFRPHLPSRKRTTIPADHTDEHSANRQAVTVTFTTARKYSPKCLFYGTVKLFRLNLLRQSYRLSMFCFVQATFILCYGSFLVYIVPFANSSGIEDQRAALLITAFGIGSFIGRPLSGLVNQKVPSLIIFEVSMFASACFVLIALLNTYPYFVISASMFGLAHGFQNTASRVMLREFVGVDNLGSAIGIYSAIGGVADLIGPIVAGSLYNASGTFSVVLYISAVSSFVGFLAMLLAPQLKKIEPGIHTEISVENV